MSLDSRIRNGLFLLGISVVCGVVLGCAGIPAERDDPRSRLVELHDESLDGTSRLPAFRLSGVGELEIEHIWLVRGEVSKASLVKLGSGEVPSAVEEERVKLRVARDGDDFFLAPLVTLDFDTTYTVVALGGGKIAEFHVTDLPIRILRRVESGEFRAGQTLHYCGEEPISDPETKVLGVTKVPVHAPEGILGVYCREFTIPQDSAEGFFAVPLLAGDLRFEPSPLWVVTSSPQECEAGSSLPLEERGGVVELEMDPGFVVHVVKSIGGEVFSETASFVAEHGRARFGPLAPLEEFVIESSAIFGSCVERRVTKLRTGEPAAYFVLGEVLADPSGPEPATEWIEIENIGNGSGSTAGLVLEDSGGATFLPDVRVPSGGFGLLVGDGFAVNPGTDVVPDAKAVRIDVESVGVRGLSNSGEKLVLKDEKGTVLSSVPALGAETGKSWQRVGTTDEPTSFILGDPTPGFR